MKKAKNKKSLKKKPSSRGKTQASGNNKEAQFELVGNVYIVEKNNGKEVSREEIDGTTVLKCLVNCLEDGMKLMESEYSENIFLDKIEKIYNNVIRSKL